eukprot:2490628-Prymnesium_polylepis.1
MNRVKTCTVPASVLGSFGFRHGAFTPHVLLTPAAAQESLTGAPSGTPPHTRVDGFKDFAVAMVNAAQRNAPMPPGERGADQQK